MHKNQLNSLDDGFGSWKSLKSYDVQFKPERLVRTNLLNFKLDGKICNLPLYAVSLLPAFFGKKV